MKRIEIARYNVEDNMDVVLFCLPGETLPFVTWCCAKGTRDTFWGHYFSNIKEAVEDFEKRGGKFDARVAGCN